MVKTNNDGSSGDNGDDNGNGGDTDMEDRWKIGYIEI
jgi:hypothetical protein